MIIPWPVEVMDSLVVAQALQHEKAPCSIAEEGGGYWPDGKDQIDQCVRFRDTIDRLVRPL